MSGSGAPRLPDGPVTLDELLADQPPERGVPGDAHRRCSQSLRSTGTRVVALDDDPTGTQVVHDVPVLTRWEEDDLDGLFDAPGALGFVLTNSRALDPDTAAARNTEIADRVLGRAARSGHRVEFVSRSDSTLRGHYPLETDVLADVAGSHGLETGPVLLCPAFPDAGRITVGDVHWVRVEDGYLPAAASEFANDATFGYRSSWLPGWVEERTAGRVGAGEVTSITLEDLRAGGPEHVGERIAARGTGTVVVANAATDADLWLLALGVAHARDAGVGVLHRSGPSIVAPLVGMHRREPLGADDLAPGIAGRRAAGAAGGLIVVGSHTGLSTAQLDGLVTASSDPVPVIVELDVAALVDDAAAEIGRVRDELDRLGADAEVVLATSRTVRTSSDAASSLALSRSVSQAIVELVSHRVATAPPAFLVAKGGITSSDVATDALGVRRARVIGQMIRGGLPVWELGPESRCPGMPYVIFPGNVGDAGTLAEVVDRLRTAGRPRAPRSRAPG